MRLCLGLVLLAFNTLLAADQGLQAVITGEHRSEASRARDEARNPLQTLQFFELRPEHAVVEIWPGGGWYSEILGPYLRAHGQFYAAHFNPQAEHPYFRKSLQAYQQKLQAEPLLYEGSKITVFDPPSVVAIAPAGSVDRVLTFRNVHNWYMRGGGDARTLAAFEAMFLALKPGGLLGVVEHRLPADQDRAAQQSSGYMHEAYVIEMAEKAGFELLARSEINANPLDTADHAKGVWCLAPSLRCAPEQLSRMLTIGESDRMTLKFRKPK